MGDCASAVDLEIVADWAECGFVATVLVTGGGIEGLDAEAGVRVYDSGCVCGVWWAVGVVLCAGRIWEDVVVGDGEVDCYAVDVADGECWEEGARAGCDSAVVY